MEGKYNTISFCETDYTEYNDYSHKNEVNHTEMYEDILSFIRIAIKNGYQMRIWNDGLTTVIEYNYADENMSGVSLEWLGEDEYVETIKKDEED